MRLLILGLLVLGGGAALALLLQQETGYVLIHYDTWSIETSLSFAALLLLLALFLGTLALRLLAGIIKAPGRLRGWRQVRRAQRDRLQVQRGLIALAQGDWPQAERVLGRSAGRSEMPLISYLGAARAAQLQHADDRRDAYLAQAWQIDARDELAISLSQAELQAASDQLEHALATLLHLHGKYPKHVRTLQLLQQIYVQLASWEELLVLLPKLRKRRALDEADIEGLERRAWEALLRQAQEGTATESAQAVWERIPRSLRQHVSLLSCRAQGLLAQGHGEQAESLLREAIKRNWDGELIRLYGLAEGKDSAQQLAQAEDWLTQHPRHALLLLSLGRLAMRAELWGKARAYLEASLGQEPRAETHQLLGELLEQLGETQAASEHFHAGLSLLSGLQPAVHAGAGKRLPLLTAD